MEQIVRRRPESTELLEPVHMAYISPEHDLVEGVPGVFGGFWGLERIGVPSRASSAKAAHIDVQDTGVHVSHAVFLVVAPCYVGAHNEMNTRLPGRRIP